MMERSVLRRGRPGVLRQGSDQVGDGMMLEDNVGLGVDWLAGSGEVEDADGKGQRRHVPRRETGRRRRVRPLKRGSLRRGQGRGVIDN